MKVVAIIQARLGSTRLPGKVLMDIAGRPMIEHVIERAQAISGIDQVVLNVPAQDAASFLPKTSCTVYGVLRQEQDVLGSYLYVAEQEQADTVIRITGDCPLLDPGICSDALALYACLDNKLAYCANDTVRSGYPDGTDCEVFSIEVLRKANECAETACEREHVTIWMRKELANYGVLAPHEWGCGLLEDMKLSVDTQEDLDCVRSIYALLKPGQFSITDTVQAWRLIKGAA